MSRKPRCAAAAVSATPVPSRFQTVLERVDRYLFLAVCVCGTAGLFFISYPKVSFSFAAWLVWAPFVWGISRLRSPWGALGYGWVTGLVTQAALLGWIYDTCLYGGGLSRALSAAAWLGLSGLMAVPFAVFAAACYFLRKTGGFFPLLAACGWVALEWLHQVIAFYGLGFPWVVLGYTQWNVPQVLYLASFTGVYGISFVLTWVGACIGDFFAEPNLKKGLGPLAVAVLIFAAVYGTGAYWQHTGKTQRSQASLQLQAAILQPNIDQYKKWTPQYEDEIALTLEGLGKLLAQENIYLAVWPESTVPGNLTDPRYTRLFTQIAQQSGAYQVIGSNIEGEEGEQYVGAYLMPPTGDHLSAYRKMKLVPFGEFIPFEKIVKYIVKDVEVMGALGAFMPGPVQQPLLDAGGVKLGSTVCYESIFPQLWRAQAQNGAQLFVNITNDAWFLDTAAPYQHLAVNVLRAAENGRPVLRAANTGISAYVDAFGHIRQQTPLFKTKILTATVPLSVREGNTFYTRWGDWFAWICAVLFFTIGISTVVFFYE